MGIAGCSILKHWGVPCYRWIFASVLMESSFGKASFVCALPRQGQTPGFLLSVVPLDGESRELTGAVNEFGLADGWPSHEAAIRLQGAEQLLIFGKNCATRKDIQSKLDGLFRDLVQRVFIVH